MFALMAVLSSIYSSDGIELKLRHRQETSPTSGRYHTLIRNETWKPAESAIIVCDVWDTHTCRNAVKRVVELAPRLNEVLIKLRNQGVTVIHAPSDCMKFYTDHPARKRAMETPKAADLPKDITSWCRQIPSEEKGEYPIDQSNGGCDDEPSDHQAWTNEIIKQGRNPKLPWIKQIDVLAIDDKKDFITDKGDEVWSILAQRGIKNVILAGVHTNMCVLGRPFGLRQLAKNGKNVVLMRDLTDTMYDPKMPPYVAHHTGTDLIVEHIEKYVCPTITSEQIVGGSPLRFSTDTRPRVAMVISESEYKTEESLPAFARSELGKGFCTSIIYGADKDGNNIRGLEALESADVVLLSVRRRTLPEDQLKVIQEFISKGKGVVGIRTASHAFSLREPAKAPPGSKQWPEFDRTIFGGNYTNHHGNKDKTTVTWVSNGRSSPLLAGMSGTPYVSDGSLYMVSPLQEGTEVLAMGRIASGAEEPVAWTFKRADGGRSVYTSLGHASDFTNTDFRKFLVNALRWAAEK